MQAGVQPSLDLIDVQLYLLALLKWRRAAILLSVGKLTDVEDNAVLPVCSHLADCKLRELAGYHPSVERLTSCSK
jgi:hypothetical protein